MLLLLRDAEHVQSRATRGTILRTAAFKTYDFETCESISLNRRQNRDSYFTCTPSFLFFFSKAVPPVLHVPGAGFIWFHDVSNPGSNPLQSLTRRFCRHLNWQNFKRQYLCLHWTFNVITLLIWFMLKQQHYEIVINHPFKGLLWHWKIKSEQQCLG